MLGKLIRHEYSQTAKMFLPMFAGVLGLAILTAITSAFAGNIFSDNAPESILANFSSLLFLFTMLALLALTFATLIIIIVRFYKNMLGDEGYLMFTLPATATQHLVSKLVVSATWLLGSVLVNIASYTFIFNTDLLEACSEIGNGLSLFANEFGNGIYLTIALLVIAGIVGMITSIMYYYMIISVGGQWANNRLTATVLAFFIINMGFQVVVFFVTAIVMMLIPKSALISLSEVISNSNPINVINIILVIITVVSAIAFTVYFFVSRWLLSKKLNLA